MDEFSTDIFTFRENTYNPPSDYVIKDDEDMGDFDINTDDVVLTDIIFGFNHIVWN